MENRPLSSADRLATSLLLGFIGLALCYGFYDTSLERREAAAQAGSFLSDTADHQTRMVEDWIMARVSAARLLANEPGNWKDPDRPSADLFSHRSFNGYTALCVYDAEDRPLLCSPSHAASIALRDAARVGKLSGSSLLLSGSGPEDCLLGARISIPPRSQETMESAAAHVVVWDDPAESLFHLLRTPPSPLGEAEALLAVPKQDGSAIFLNPLPFQGSGGFLSVPLGESRLAARAALQGPAAFGRFTDYAGTEVFAAVRSVPGPGWGIVIKLPVSSVFGAAQDRIIIRWLLVAALIVTGILGHSFWKQRLQRGLQKQLDAETTLSASQEALAAMTRAALRSSQEQAREWTAAFDATQDAILLCSPEGIILRANRMARELSGTASPEGTNICFLMHGEAKHLPGCPLAGARQTRSRGTIELERSGRWLSISVDPLYDEHGAFRGTVHTARDISAMKAFLGRLNRLNACLLERTSGPEENIRRLVELCGSFFGADFALYYSVCDLRLKVRSAWNAPEDLMTEDGQDDRVWTAPGSRGGEPEVLSALPAAPLGGTDPLVSRHGLKTVFKATVKGRGMAHGFLCAAFRKDWTAAEEDLRLLGILASAVAFEEEHARLEGKFLQSQKMEAVGRLAGGVAHDFNNILTAIRGYAEFLMASLGKDDIRREDAREILTAAERAAALTGKLLSFSRKQVLSFVPADLNELIHGMRNMMERLLGEDIRLVTTLQPSIPLVRIDPGQFEQAVLNLAVNARDAMPKGGVLTITSSTVSLPGHGASEVEGLPKGPYVLLAVSDTGTGMSQETLSHLFEPFFTTKERGKGTGLGLPMVYGLIKQCGGDISVNSALDQGTAWCIFLPAAPGTALKTGAPAVPGAPVAMPSGGTETILLVEDEPAVLALSRRTLKEAGYAILPAISGESALQALADHKGPVHLLLTDVIMPGMDGLALGERVSALRPEIKVLFMSGYTDDLIGRHGVLEEDVRLVHKPFDRATLLAEVRRILDSEKEPAADAPDSGEPERLKGDLSPP